jgi:hypothetical protein
VAKSAPARDGRTTEKEPPDFSFSIGILYADKDECVSKNRIFTIHRINFEQNAGFDGGDRWAVTVSYDDGRESEIITLGSNDRRDAELRAAAVHIERHGPIPNARLVRFGKAYYFRTTASMQPS